MENYEWIDLVPKGWRALVSEMIRQCEAIDPTYTIVDMKEKWGHLSVDSHCDNYGEEITQIELEYWRASANVCYNCGAPSTKVTTQGWLLPICEQCAALA